METLGVSGAVIGFVELLKSQGMPSNFAPAVAVVLGLAAWLLIGPAGQEPFGKILEGIGLGALAPAVVFLAGRIGAARG